MSRRHITFLKGIHEFIKRKNVKFLIHDIPGSTDHGYCITTTNNKSIILIVLDPRKEFIPTLIHECLHGIYPHYKEDKIKSLERMIMKDSTCKQYRDLLLCFSTHGKLYTKAKLSDLF